MNRRQWEGLAVTAGLGSMIGLGGQIWTLWITKSVISTSEIWMWSLVYIMAVWMIYGFKIKSFALWFTDLICLLETFVIIFLYYSYR